MLLPHRHKMGMAPLPSTPTEVGISYDPVVAAVAVLCRDGLGVVDTYAPEVLENAVDNGMVVAAASGGEPGAGESGEPEVVARDEPGMETAEHRGAAGGDAQDDHGASCAQFHCGTPVARPATSSHGGDDASRAPQTRCGTPVARQPASYHGGDASRAPQNHCGTLAARQPASWRGGEASQTEVQGTPSLVARHRRLELVLPPAGTCTAEAGRHRQHRVPKPELPPVRRQCSRTGASQRERGEGQGSSC